MIICVNSSVVASSERVYTSLSNEHTHKSEMELQKILYIQVNDLGGQPKDAEIPFIGFRWGEPISGVCR